MICAPKETDLFRALPALVILRIANRRPLGGFMNDRNDSALKALLQVDCVAVVDVDDGVDHIGSIA